jgi:hypothetical protein
VLILVDRQAKVSTVVPTWSFRVGGSVVNYQWSEHAEHIQSLYPLHQESDGYDEGEVSESEHALGYRLPDVLRLFFLSWGARADLARQHERLLMPHQLIVRESTLVFCVEHQSTYYWGIPIGSLDQENPLVSVASSGREPSVWDGQEALNWQDSPTRVSDFLDALGYEHAFYGGAVHGGSSEEPADEPRINVARQHWHRIEIRSTPYYLDRESDIHRWIIRGDQGVAIDWGMRFAVAAQSEAALDMIGRTLNITWRVRW